MRTHRHTAERLLYPDHKLVGNHLKDLIQFQWIDLVGWVSVGDAQRFHGANHGVHRHEDVLVDEFDETAPVVVRVTGAVNDSHLFDERALARLSRTFTPDNVNTATSYNGPQSI